MSVMSHVDTTDDLFQIALLVDQLRHDDVHHRVTAVRALVSIASALGTERTRDELIPFLTESTDDENEVLVVIAERLGELVRFVGGRDYAHILLTPLEPLVMSEQLSVREAAIASTETVVEYMSQDTFTNYYIPFVTRLAKRDLYLARMSATYLLPVCFHKLSDVARTDFSALFLCLCDDGTPLVRRAAAINFSKMIKAASPAQMQPGYTLAFENFSKHEQESIRIQSIGICVTLSETMPLEFKMSRVLPVVLSLCKDKAWRVRYTLVNRLHEVLARLPSAELPLAAAYDALLQDLEAEVRAAAAASMAVTCKHLSRDTVHNKLLSSIQRLTIDNSDTVRVAVAAGLGGMVSVLGKDETVECVLPMLLALLRDEASDVRLNVLARLDAINEVLGIEVLSQSLLPALASLAADIKWRVRLAVIQHMPLLLNQVSAAFFGDKFTDMCLAWLSDPVFAVRCAAVDNLKVLHTHLGESWTCTCVIPKLETLTSNKSYLLRLTGLHAIQALSSCLSVSNAEKHLIPRVLHLAKDPVPNIRMNCARALLTLLKVLPASNSFRQVVVENLAELSSDSDRDVKAAAAQTLKETGL